MKKILIPMLLITGSIIKAETASTKATELGAPSKLGVLLREGEFGAPSKFVMVLLRAGGVRSNRINAWVDALKKSNTEAGFAIKTYVASKRNTENVMVGADVIELRKAVENNTQPIENDIVMGTFVMEGHEDSVTLDSNIHYVEVMARDSNEWELRKDVSEKHGEYTWSDSCTKCVSKWKAIVEYDKSRVIYHVESSCKSDFPKEVFIAEITEDQV